MSAREAVLVHFSQRLTRLTRATSAADIDELRAQGLDDAGVRWLVQVVGYFNYVNRHVDGLGLELEADHPGRAWADLALERASGAP